MIEKPVKTTWLSPSEFHRFEGIFIYFGFLLLLFMVSERMSSSVVSHAESASGWWRRSVFPLTIYYAMTLAIPLANSAAHPGTIAAEFWEHSLFVLLTPLVLVLLLAAIGRLRQRPGFSIAS